MIVKGNTARWYHISANAPGRHYADLPTVLNGVEWNPTWPDVPDARNRDCKCHSSTYTGVPALWAGNQVVLLTVVQARSKVRIAQQPNSGNGYMLVVEFNDDAPPGADWYEVKLQYYSR